MRTALMAKWRTDDGHVVGTMAGAQARTILTEDDVEDPVEAVLDAPVAADGGGCG